MDFKIGVIVASAILLLICVYLDIKRKNKHWLAGRIVCHTLLILSLALLAIPLQYSVKEIQLKNKITIITAGSNIDSILKKESKAYYADPSLRQILKSKAIYLPDLAYHLAENPSIKQLEVYGYGLAQTDLDKLDATVISFHPAPLPNGVVSCSWPALVQQEEILSVQGKYQNHGKSPIQLKLVGFGVDLDSATIEARQNQTFTLKFQMRQKGKALLKLVALAKEDTVAKEVIPVQSIPKTPIGVTILSSFPSFEYKFLKDWWYAQSYPVALRSRISKDKFSTDFLNRNSFNLQTLTANQLQKEDILMLNQQEFDQSSAAEQQAIWQAVANGLGLIIWLDDPNPTGRIEKNVKRVDQLTADKVADLQLANTQLRLSGISTDLKWFLQLQKGQQALITNSRGQTVATEELYGAGKIVYTTLQNSYQWLLNGDKESYANYWTTLANAAARKKRNAIDFNSTNQFPTINQKATFQIVTQDAKVPAVNYLKKQVNITQNLLFNDQWQAQIWPTNYGWQTLNINGENKDFYVFNSSDWKGVRHAETLKNNLDYTNHDNKRNSDQTIEEINSIKEVSKTWFLIIVILSASFLWFENKHYARK